MAYLRHLIRSILVYAMFTLHIPEYSLVCIKLKLLKWRNFLAIGHALYIKRLRHYRGGSVEAHLKEAKGFFKRGEQ